MIGLGTLVNVLAILAGGLAGLVLKKFLSARITGTVMQGVGLAVVVIGISGAVGSAYTLIMIASLALGGLIGSLLKLEERLDGFARFCEAKFTKPDESSTFSQGFVTATLVFCVGSMAVVGALEDGINNNHDILFAKSVLDGIAAMVFAQAMGAGVLLSAVAVGLYQGLLTVLAVFIAPYLGDTVVAQMSFVGSVLIMGIGLNLLKITKLKVGNLLPAMFVPVIIYAFLSLR